MSTAHIIAQLCMLATLILMITGKTPIYMTAIVGAAISALILKTVESTLSQIRRRRARGTSGLWPSSP